MARRKEQHLKSISNVLAAERGLLAEQNTKIALNCADYACILQDNRVVVVGAAKELAKNEEVKKFYPGLSAAGRNSPRDIKTLSAPKAIADVMRP
jgi:hypothetical protein